MDSDGGCWFEGGSLGALICGSGSSRGGLLRTAIAPGPACGVALLSPLHTLA